MNQAESVLHHPGMSEFVTIKAPRTAVSVSSSVVIPAAIADAGEHAVRRFLEFFAATIRNRNTREAYYRAACSFFAWLEQHGIGELADIEPMPGNGVWTGHIRPAGAPPPRPTSIGMPG